jgi:hypothetical protein
MNLNARKHPITAFDREAKLSGVGANAIWNGPFDTTALPKSKGSSSGKDGIILNTVKPVCDPRAITQRAKGKY